MLSTKVVKKADIEEDLLRAKKHVKSSIEDGVLVPSDRDAVYALVNDALERAAHRLQQQPTYVTPGRTAADQHAALRKISRDLNSVHELLLSTEKRRGLFEVIGRFISSKLLPTSKVPIDEDPHFSTASKWLLYVAEKTLNVAHFIADRPKGKISPKAQETWDMLKRASTFTCDLFKSFLESLATYPIFLDEYEGFIHRIVSVVDELHELASKWDWDPVEGFSTPLGTLSRKLICLNEEYMDATKNQLDRFEQFEQQYGNSRRTTEEMEQAGKPYNSATLAEVLVSRFGVLPVKVEEGKGKMKFEPIQGGYGAVYHLQTADGSQVAVKEIKILEGMSEHRVCLRLLREVSVLSAIRRSGGSERILELKGFSSGYGTGPLPCLVTSWCSGGTLYMNLDNRKPNREKLKLVLEVAEGLRFLHNLETPIVHADIKSHNVLVRDGSAVLSDFGLSRLMDGKEEFSTRGATSKLWDAPELSLPYTEKTCHPSCMSDIYSFGSVFLEVMIGDVPFSWLPRREPLRSWLTPFDVPPPTAPPRDDADSRLGENLGSSTATASEGSRPFDAPHTGKVYCPTEEHWEFMKLCWSRNLWSRPTASVAVDALADFLRGSPG